jgi:hypothetical protein
MVDTVTNKLKHRRRLGQFAATQGRQSMPIDLVGPLTKLAVRLQFTEQNGATAPSGVLFQQNARFLQKIEVIVQGRDPVWSITPAYYAARRQYEARGVPMRGMETVISATASANTPVDLTIPLHFDLVRGRRRDDAAIDLRGLTLAQCLVTFGSTTASDLWTTPGATVALTGITCSIEGEYILNSDPKNDQYVVREMIEILTPIVSSSNNFAFDVDARTGIAIRSLPLFFITANQGDDTLMPVAGGWALLQAGSRQFVNSETAFIKADARDEMEIPAAQEIAGVDYIDVLQFGQLSSSIPTGKLDANLKFILNVTMGAGPSNVICQRESTRPLKI